MEQRKIRLSYRGKPESRIYLIQQFDGMSVIGEMWSNLESGSIDAMRKSFNSDLYKDCKKSDPESILSQQKTKEAI